MTCVRTLGRYLPAGHPLNPGPGGALAPPLTHTSSGALGVHTETQRSPLTLKVMSRYVASFTYTCLGRRHSPKGQRTCQTEVGITYAAK